MRVTDSRDGALDGEQEGVDEAIHPVGESGAGILINGRGGRGERLAALARSEITCQIMYYPDGV